MTLQTLRTRSSSPRTFQLAAHLFAALLPILDPSLFSSSLLQRASLVIVSAWIQEILAAAPLLEQRRSPGLGVTSSTSRKLLPDVAHRLRDIPNGKKASRSRDRISEIPTAAPFAVGLERAGGGAGHSSTALVLRIDESKKDNSSASATSSPLLDPLRTSLLSASP